MRDPPRYRYYYERRGGDLRKILRQLTPLPFMYPRKPSSRHIFARLGSTPLYAWPDVLDCTCLVDPDTRKHARVSKQATSLALGSRVCSDERKARDVHDDLEPFQGRHSSPRGYTSHPACHKVLEKVLFRRKDKGTSERPDGQLGSERGVVCSKLMRSPYPKDLRRLAGSRPPIACLDNLKKPRASSCTLVCGAAAVRSGRPERGRPRAPVPASSFDR